MRVFISYRREETAAYAGRLRDDLARKFGRSNVFMDIDAIRPGTDFKVAIRDALAACNVAVVLIGRRWAAITDSSGARRLDNEKDFVRLEVETALSRTGLGVVPVLVDKASMPNEKDLPPPLRALAALQASELSDERWQYDVDRLFPRNVWPRRIAIVAALAVAVLIVGSRIWRYKDLTGKCIRTTIEHVENLTRSLVDDPQQSRSPSAGTVIAQLDQTIAAYGNQAVHSADETAALDTVKQLRWRVVGLTMEVREDSPNQRVLNLVGRLEGKFRLSSRPRLEIVVTHDLPPPERVEQLKEEKNVDLVSPKQLDEIIDQYWDYRHRYDKAVHSGFEAVNAELEQHVNLSERERNTIRQAQADKAMQTLVDNVANEIDVQCKNDAAKMSFGFQLPQRRPAYE